MILAYRPLILRKSPLPALTLLLCALFSFRGFLERLYFQWTTFADYSHGLLILPIAVYLGWLKRDALKRAEVGTDWKALPFLLLSGLLFLAGELGAELFTSRVAMLLLVVGAAWLVYGPEAIKILRFPLAFLLLMFPLPGFIYRNLTFDLQLFASIGSVHLLHLLGISAFQEGNMIDVGFSRLQIAEACSGLRYVFPLLTVGLLFAYLGQRALWKRLVLVGATIPIAIAANILRVSGTAVIGVYWGSEAARGFFHSFSGWAVFLVCTVLFCVLHLALKRIPEKENRRGGEVLKPRSVKPERGVQWSAAALGALVILATPPLVGALSQVAPVPIQAPLASFPLAFEGRQGERREMGPWMEELIGAQDYLSLEYMAPGERPISLYAAYYEYQRKAGEFAHSPRLCLPGAGWFIEESGVRALQGGPGEGGEGLRLSLNELVVRRREARQLVYYWYQGRGRNFTNEFAAKFYMIWDGLWRRRTDGALVRIMAPLKPGENPEQARRVMDSFAMAAFGELQRYLP